MLVRYRSIKVGGLSVFYRESGWENRRVLLLLHGFPSSSRMYEPLLRRLSDEFHLIAPDYPGFGHSDCPDPREFSYTFDHIAEVMRGFIEALGLGSYSLYLQDYGGPVGFRLALDGSKRLQSLIVQNAVAHEAGLGPLWETRRAFWQDREAHQAAIKQNLMSLSAARYRHVGTSPNAEFYDPDLWTDEYAFLSRPGQLSIQSDLFYDYRNNVALYPAWQAWLRAHRPRLLILWGQYDPSFMLNEAQAYRADVPDAEVNVLKAGHFALDEKADEIARIVRAFFRRWQEQ
ncbi:alpha/beta hydrolase [Caballeronia sp. LZ016]|uniref:alpha/beta fold hydrolase n=1 Tax=Caballeronia sp. LZ016 TaxID=3038554 RepID=UPI00285C3B9A|nr:alpha/beta hydrolase [Caballeronia sp. LZ016]MDR5740112.1 alpha/beta hydrolase [Caballeronia sp. LZ016]